VTVIAPGNGSLGEKGFRKQLLSRQDDRFYGSCSPHPKTIAINGSQFLHL